MKNFIYPLILILSVIIADLSVLMDIAIYRQVFGFLLITQIPGLLIIRIINLKSTSLSKTVLYSAGLSVALMMFLGFFLNFAGPMFGIDKPISTIPLLAAINVVILMLLVTYLIVRSLDCRSLFHLRESFAAFCSPQGLYLLLILLVGIMGGLAIQYYICSLFSVIAMFLIAIAAVLIAFDKFIGEEHYIIALFVMGLALLLTRTLTSPYLGGSDIYVELFYQKITEFNAYWNPDAYPGTCNAMLSTVILPTVYSAILGIDVIWVYKIVFSILFALVPVTLYHAFKGSLNPKFSFFSVFLFMSFYAFFTSLLWLPRQQIAELYLALLMLTLFEEELKPSLRNFLTITWIPAMVVSHYATTYITLFFMVLVTLMLFIFREKSTSINLSKTIFAIVMALSWYIFISLSRVFRNIVIIVKRISFAAMNELFSPNAIDPLVGKAMGSGLLDQSFWHALGHMWQYGTQVLLLIGFAYITLRYLLKKSQPEFTFLSVVGMLFLFLSMTLPYFASSLNMDRIYHIVLIFISPLCVIGLLYLIEKIYLIYNISTLPKQKLISVCLVLVFVPYFLFNSGAIFEITEKDSNLAIKIDPTKDYSEYYSNSTYFFLSRVPSEDFVARNWISSFRIADSPIYSDIIRQCELWDYGHISFNDVFGNEYPPVSGGYVFIGRQNIIDNVYICSDKAKVHSSVRYSFDQIQPHLDLRDRIYSNGAVIYK